MELICTKCDHRGTGRFVSLNNFKIPLAGLLIGYALNNAFQIFYFKDLSDKRLGEILIKLLILSFIGIVLVISYYKQNRNRCPKCHYGHMVGINTVRSNKI